jgi:hypothetical protein
VSSRSQGQGNFTETAVYGAPACKDPHNCTWAEASNRIVYTTLGSHIDGLSRSVSPAMPWGDVTLLMKTGSGSSSGGGTASVRDMVGIAPLDTGSWEQGCVHKPPNWPPFPANPPEACAAAWWPPILGTFDHFDHLLLGSILGRPGSRDFRPGKSDGLFWFVAAKANAELNNTSKHRRAK